MKKWITFEYSEYCSDSSTISESAGQQTTSEKMTDSLSYGWDLESTLDKIILQTVQEIQVGGKWNVTAEVRAVEDAIDVIFAEVMTGSKTVDDYRAACQRWKEAGSM